jgi:hypothetical protein
MLARKSYASVNLAGRSASNAETGPLRSSASGPLDQDSNVPFDAMPRDRRDPIAMTPQ